MEARCELLKSLRLPAYTLPTLAFPTLFYVMFSLVLGPAPVPAYNGPP